VINELFAKRPCPSSHLFKKLHFQKQQGEKLSNSDIAKMLNNLKRIPLGIEKNSEFRISIAGTQEKTALLYYNNNWLRPLGTTPTTHILKPPIGKLPIGLDLTDSVENEYFCLKLMRAFNVPTTEAEIIHFNNTKTLAVKRFDRKWLSQNKLIRIPQEDCCQALSIAPTRKYQNEGGPSLIDILNLLKGSDTPLQDQKQLVKTQILFWLMGATDGHGKNFSIFLGYGGRYKLTPVYDVMSIQPNIDKRQIDKKQVKLAMSVGNNNHYKLDDIQPEHFVQTVKRAKLPTFIAEDMLHDVKSTLDKSIEQSLKKLPRNFPEKLTTSIIKGVITRSKRI